jgi:membrane peptidoglycan carboxypeptidase
MFRAGSATAQRLGVLAVVSVVAGLLMAGMLLPIVGGVGLLARTAADDFDNLPSELNIEEPPQVSRILAADGSTIATFYYQNRVNVTLDEVPPVMQKAIIAVEDVRFYEHNGVDWKGAFRALVRNGSTGTVQQGGSTLTQQFVKNVLIESAEAKGDKEGVAAAHADTLARKAREAKYALALENRFSKRQILEGYLNIAYFGDSAYGVGSAARHFFGKPVQRLDLEEAALLAGLVQSPEVYNPVHNPDAAKARRNTVLGQMLKYRFIDQAAYDHAVRQPVRLHVHQQGNGCEASRAPYFCDYVQHVIRNSPAFGRTKADRTRLLLRGGLTIRTTLDPQVQRAADRAVRDYVAPRDKSGVAAAEAVVEPGSGKVLALSVNRPYGQDRKRGQNTLNYAVDHADGGGIGFQMGSTFKLFVLAAAMKQGIPLSTNIYSPAHIDLTGFKNCFGTDAGEWDVSNAGDSEAGHFNLITGTWISVNTFFAQLEQRTGLCQPTKIAEAMGMSPATGGHISQYPAFALGAADTYSPLDLASAYATVAAHGTRCDPMAITEVTDPTGKALRLPQSECEQVLEPGLADTITDILHGVLTKPGATATGVGEPGRPAAAKTGTAEENTASVFAGFVPQMAAAVWVGDPDEPSRSLNNLTIGGRSYGQVYGATIAGPIWHDTLEAALRGEPVIPLPKPDPKYVRGIKKTVPDVRGLMPDDASDVLREAGFKVSFASQPIDSAFPRGTVARTTPAGGQGAPPGSTVVVYLSTGHLPPPPTLSASPGTTPSATLSPTPPPRGTGSPSPSPTGTPSPSASPTCSPKNHGQPGC